MGEAPRLGGVVEGQEQRMAQVERPPTIVRWTRGLEDAAVLDGPVQAVEPTIRNVFGSGSRGAAGRGEWRGHSGPPLLTDLTLGAWTSATLLDLLGGRGAHAAAQRLVGLGLLTFPPTAWTGWAEWSAAPQREKRVGLVHAVTNGAASTVYAASWLARRRGRHDTGARLALAGGAMTAFGGYLGAHLIGARKVASRHPAYGDEVAHGAR